MIIQAVFYFGMVSSFLGCWRFIKLLKMEGAWIFSAEEIQNSPISMKLLKNKQAESLSRLNATVFLQRMGDKLRLTQHCRCIATVFLHRFYMYISKNDVKPKKLSAVALFLSGKAHNEFRKIEPIIKCYDFLTTPRKRPLEVKSKEYHVLKEEFFILESLLLQVLGFQVHVELPHPHVITISEKRKGGFELTRVAYFLATTSFMVTTMCLQYTPTVVACVCLNLASRYTGIQLDPGDDGSPWFRRVVPSMSQETIDNLTDELGSGILRGTTLEVKTPDFELVLRLAEVEDRARKLVSIKDEKSPRLFPTPPKSPLPEPTEYCGIANEIKVQIPRSYLLLK